MPVAASVVLLVYAIIGIFIVTALIFLIRKRLKDKKNEFFEKRDN